MATFLSITGIQEFDETLSYLRDKAAKRIGRKAVNRMAAIVAKYQRREIADEDWAPKTSDKGISSRATKGRMSNIRSAKAGIGVGAAQKKQGITVNRGRRKGVGMSARNLHWFGLGTQDRYTGTKGTGYQRRKGKLIIKGRRYKATGKPRKFTGRIDKLRFGGFIQRGTAAASNEAMRAATNIIQTELAKEVQAANRGGRPTPGSLGTIIA